MNGTRIRWALFHCRLLVRIRVRFRRIIRQHFGRTQLRFRCEIGFFVRVIVKFLSRLFGGRRRHFLEKKPRTHFLCSSFNLLKLLQETHSDLPPVTRRYWVNTEGNQRRENKTQYHGLSFNSIALFSILILFSAHEKLFK